MRCLRSLPPDSTGSSPSPSCASSVSRRVGSEAASIAGDSTGCIAASTRSAIPPFPRAVAGWTAVVACGPGALLSHRSAAALWGLRASARAAIDVTSPSRAGRVRARIDVHRGTGLISADMTSVDHIPCTAVARTLLDLASLVDRRALERAYEQADVLGVLDVGAIVDLLARSRRRGASALRDVVSATECASGLTRSELEARFLAARDEAGVPRPRVNAWVPLSDRGAEVDFLWPNERLIVETDGHRVHGTRAAFERDRRRDRSLMLAGWRVVRFTWLDVVSNPDEVVTTIRDLLARAENGAH
jgi:REase_MTES_1575